MKKIITSLLIFVLLFNFIFCRNFVYAAPGEPDLPEQSGKEVFTRQNASISNTALPELMESGTVSQRQGSGSKVAGLMVGDRKSVV